MTLPGGSQPDSQHGRTGTAAAQVVVLALLVAQAALLALIIPANGSSWQTKALTAVVVAAAGLYLLSSIVRGCGKWAPYILAAAAVGLGRR
jgi:hypothetical protein